MTHDVHPIAGWEGCATAPGAVDAQAATSLPSLQSLLWEYRALGPAATAASLLRSAGRLALDEGNAPRLDGEDWWFRAELPRVDTAPEDELVLRLGGLATLADVWLDGAPLLSSANMFTRHDRVVAHDARELVVRCRALDTELAARRPRPRWKTPMVEHQQLRWFRTTLLGRTPGWSPPIPAVGPWRGAALTVRRHVHVDDVRLRATVQGTTGVAEVTCHVRALGTSPAISAVVLVLACGERVHRVTLAAQGAGVWAGRLDIADAERWWPHTHGQPTLYRAALHVGDHVHALGAVGFRDIVRDGDFSVAINGVPLFCRGACWTPLDAVTLASSRDATAHALSQVCDMGMNMLRVSGAMVYESDDFYDLLDERGILLWQDFMFANMDYPDEDASFVESAAAEARDITARLAHRPALAVLCGSSESEQQAAMFGAAPARWRSPMFHDVLAGVARELAPDVPYWPSSAHGGAFPHDARSGTTSYYGVGAYLRGLDDARRAEVRFATECLAFANVPEAAGGATSSSRVHHARWKARTPRDQGAGWDFDDVRDHYVQRLFGVDPAALRYADHERYLALGRAAVGEAMAQAFGEWRRAASPCRGALVWFLRDLWDGAGWGLVDARGTPKSPYWHLRRALQPIAMHISDEGTNGLDLHVTNDGADPIHGAELELALFRDGEMPCGNARLRCDVPARGTRVLNGCEVMDGFFDLGWAYRFGPPMCDLVVATLRLAAGGPPIARAFHFPLGLPHHTRDAAHLGLTASARALSSHEHELTVRTARFAQSVVVEAEGYVASDAWFHVPPGGEHTLRLRPDQRGATAPPPLRGVVNALNALDAVKIVAL